MCEGQEEEQEVFARLFCQFVVQNLSSEVTYITSFYGSETKPQNLKL